MSNRHAKHERRVCIWLALLVVAVALAACGDDTNANRINGDGGAVFDLDNGDGDSIGHDSLTCVDESETWRIAGTITAGDVAAQPVTLQVWASEHRFCCVDPAQSCMTVPGDLLGGLDLVAPGAFDVEIEVPWTSRSGPPTLALILRADLDGDGFCGRDDAGRYEELPPGDHDELVLSLEAGCPGPIW